MKVAAVRSRFTNWAVAWVPTRRAAVVALGGMAAWALLAFIATPAQATIIWKADFEASNVSEWNGSTSLMNGTRKNLEYVTDTVQSGNIAAKITIHPDDLFEPYSQSRVEVKHQCTRTGEGQDTYISWWFQMKAHPGIRDNIAYFETNVSFQNLMTFFVEPKAGGSSNIVFGAGNLGTNRRWTQELVLNKWHQLAIHVKWSANAATGLIEVWYDGVKVVTHPGRTKVDNNSAFFQTGLHRSDPAPPVDTIYIDNFIEADNIDEILAKPGPDGGVSMDGGTDASADAARDGGGTGGSSGADAAGSGGSGGSAGAGGSSGSGGVTGTGGSSSGTGGASSGGSSGSGSGGSSAGTG
ncbi:MAG TPA: heparin lyase I family protein, partial [Polyangia bacterium]